MDLKKAYEVLMEGLKDCANGIKDIIKKVFLGFRDIRFSNRSRKMQ